MKNSILKLINEATKKNLGPDIQKFAEANGLQIGEGDGKISFKAASEQIKEAEEYVYGLFTRETVDGKHWEPSSIDFREAMASSDSSVIFRRVISEILIEPREPSLFLLNNVANDIKLDAKAPLTVTFPVVSAFQAFEIAEGGEYRQQQLSFQEHIISLRLKKIGVMAGLTEEIVEQSIYPLVALNLRLMANGLNRKKEDLLFKGLYQKATEVFNNDNYTPAPLTTGVASNQTWNGSLSLRDILKLASVVVGNRYEPSHMLVHPLAFYIIFEDPIIRSLFYTQGQLGSTVWGQKPDFDQSVNMPFGIKYVPYYALPYNETGTFINAPGSGDAFAPALETDVYVIDSKNSLAMISRGDNEFDDYDDWFHDTTVMKAKAFINAAAMDSGRGMTVARNVMVVRNYEPLFVVQNTV